MVELVVATPVEWRTFVSVTPAATKSILDSFLFQNILSMYILSMKQQKTGQKTDKNPTKKPVFSVLLDSALGQIKLN